VVEVLQGLTSGATVVSAGHQKLYDGAHVIPIAAGSDQKKTKMENQ